MNRRLDGMSSVQEREHHTVSKRPPLTIAVINFNGCAVLEDTLRALVAVDYQNVTLVLYDDASSDESVAWTKQHFPQVQVVTRPVRAGRPSTVRNMALAGAQTRYVMLIDNDVALAPDCPDRLMDVMLAHPDVVGCGPRLFYRDDPGRIYYDGSGVHYLGITSGSRRGAAAADRQAAEPQWGVLGGNALIDRDRARDLGYFDEGYDFGWGEDADLFIRGRVAGLHAFHVPAAGASHVERERGLVRAEAQIYNRQRSILTVYSARSLLLLAPALLTFEFCLVVMGLTTGLLTGYYRAWWRTLRNLPELRATRSRIQASRRVSDTEILDAGDFFPTGALARSGPVVLGVRLAQALFGGYWRLVRRWL